MSKLISKMKRSNLAKNEIAIVLKDKSFIFLALPLFIVRVEIKESMPLT